MPVIYIDNVLYEVEGGQDLLTACLSLGLNVPHFCWHPALHSVGACRQCAVKMFRDEKDTRGFIVMSCLTGVEDGCRISINDPEVKRFRASVIEWLMANHPHDCPVCDEGGECHLQDMTVMTGHNYRKYAFKKRTYKNQDLGPFIHHEMNRCIQCYRCLRYYRDYAGGRDFNVFGIHQRVSFGRAHDGTLENEFSGNLVEVCPTGVFTDKTFRRHFTRKWDLQTAPSICPHCGLGCNTIPGERYGTLRRILNRYNSEVNGYFLCDRGRFGYEFVNSDRRITRPLVKQDSGPNAFQEAVTGEEALTRFKEIFRESKGVVGIGSPRASLEANFALRSLVGADRFSCGMSSREQELVGAALGILRDGPVSPASLHDVELSDAALVLGEDVTNVAPRLALALRQAALRKLLAICEKLNIPRWNEAAVRELVRHEKGPLFIATPFGTRLDDAAAETYHAAPDDIARLGFAVANRINPYSPAVEGLSADPSEKAAVIAQALLDAHHPLVVAGVTCGEKSVLHAAANVAWALHSVGRPVKLSFTMPECNSLGVALMGGMGLEQALGMVREGTADTVVILENDLFRRVSLDQITAFLDSCKNVVVLDHLSNESTSRSDLVFPAATFAEADGTFVNNEGRAARFYQVFKPLDPIKESWRWLRDMMAITGKAQTATWHRLDDIVAAMADSEPIFEPLPTIAPPADFRAAGQKIPRQSHRESGRTAILANVTVHEPAPPADPDSALTFSMEGYRGIPPSSLTPRYWASGWNSVQALYRFQERISGPLRGGDPGKRLIEPDEHRDVSYFRDVPARFEARDGKWLIVPAHHIFGSEELSVLSPGIAERTTRPYLGLYPQDAGLLELNEGQYANLMINGKMLTLPVRMNPTLPRGVASLPKGLPEMEWMDLPAWGRVTAAGEDPRGFNP